VSVWIPFKRQLYVEHNMRRYKNERLKIIGRTIKMEGGRRVAVRLWLHKRRPVGRREAYKREWAR
jgi:hypothetical protein